jgi:hypothetical protein
MLSITLYPAPRAQFAIRYSMQAVEEESLLKAEMSKEGATIHVDTQAIPCSDSWLADLSPWQLAAPRSAPALATNHSACSVCTTCRLIRKLPKPYQCPIFPFRANVANAIVVATMV